MQRAVLLCLELVLVLQVGLLVFALVLGTKLLTWEFSLLQYIYVKA